VKNWLRFLIALWLAIGSAYGFSFGHDKPTLDTGGPFPYARDGIVFGNFEKQLPPRQRGYYHEYTVKTPWRSDRGPRRIIAGREDEYYYTDDHYRSFRRIRE
jgi:ribonuclease T1